MAVDDFLYENQLSLFLDYSITARTLSGLIYVEIDLYTEEAKKLARKLPSLNIMLNEQTLNVALIQLGSELQRAFGMAGQGNAARKMLAEELHVLDAQNWINIDEVAVIEPLNLKLVPGSFFDLKDKKEILTKEVDISYVIDHDAIGSDAAMLALSIYIAKLISANVQAALSSQFGFYINEVNYTFERQIAKLTHSLRIVKFLELNVEDIKQVTGDSLADLYEQKAFSRLIGALSRAATTNSDCIFPDPYTLYKQTNIIIGAKGWRQIATEENCKMILAHMKVVISVGDARASLDVATMPLKD